MPESRIPLVLSREAYLPVVSKDTKDEGQEMRQAGIFGSL